MTRPPLREVQIEALRRAAGKEGYLWAADPGLGKSRMALEEFERLAAAGIVDRLLILCPKPVIDVWTEQMAEHDFSLPADRLLIINFEAVLGQGAERIKKFLFRQFKVMLVVDESHRLKNFRAKSTRWVTNELMLRVRIVRCLTGTPLAESPMDLYPQLRLAGATMGTNPYTWRNRWCELGGYMGKQFIRARNEQQMAEFIAPHLFRATKEEWGKDLPEKSFRQRRLTMNREQARLYRELEQEGCSTLLDGREVTIQMVLTLLLRLSQVGMGFVGSDDGTEAALPGPNPKLDALEDYALQFGAQGNKFIVMVVHQWAAVAATQRLEKLGLRVVGLHGRSPTSVDEAKAAFNTDDTTDCLVGTVKKAGVGLTLLGTKNRPCSDMIFLQQSYSLIDRLQTVDRIHRFGQKYPCSYLDLTVSETDAVVLAALAGKADMVSAIMGHLKRLQEERRL